MFATRRSISGMLLALAVFLTLGGAIAFIVYAARYYPKFRGAELIDVIYSAQTLSLIPFVLLAVAVIGYKLAQCHNTRAFGIGSLWLGTIGMLVGSTSHAMGPFYLPSALTLVIVATLITRNAIRPAA